MRWIVNSGALGGVACAVLTVTYVLGQEPKREAPQRAEPDRKAANAINQAVIQKARAVPPDAVMPAPAEGELAPLVEQFTRQFRPIMRAELHLLRAVCGLQDEQRKRLADEGERTLESAAKRFAELQFNMMRGRGARANPDAREILQQGVAEFAKALLSPEQLARYEAEVGSRAENHKRVAVLNLVSRIDQDLILSAAQRDELCESLSSNWNNLWCPQLELLAEYSQSQFFPNIPEACIAPILNSTQKELWRGLQNNRRSITLGRGFVGMQLDNELFADEDADKPLAAPRAPAAVVSPIRK